MAIKEGGQLQHWLRPECQELLAMQGSGTEGFQMRGEKKKNTQQKQSSRSFLVKQQKADVAGGEQHGQGNARAEGRAWPHWVEGPERTAGADVGMNE